MAQRVCCGCWEPDTPEKHRDPRGSRDVSTPPRRRGAAIATPPRRHCDASIRRGRRYNLSEAHWEALQMLRRELDIDDRVLARVHRLFKTVDIAKNGKVDMHELMMHCDIDRSPYVRRADISLMNRGGAAAGTHTEMSRGGAAAGTRIVRGR